MRFISSEPDVFQAVISAFIPEASNIESICATALTFHVDSPVPVNAVVPLKAFVMSVT